MIMELGELLVKLSYVYQVNPLGLAWCIDMKF